MNHDASTGAPAPHPSFTVIIPTYNRPDLLSEAVASVLGQTFTDWELIIVDDCSPQPVEPWLDPRVSVIRNETNRGRSCAHSTRSSASHGRGWPLPRRRRVGNGHRLDHARRAYKLAPGAVRCARTMTPGGEVPSSVEPWTWRTPIPSGGALLVDRSTSTDFPPGCKDAFSCWIRRPRPDGTASQTPSPAGSPDEEA